MEYQDKGWIKLNLENAWLNYQSTPTDWDHAAYRVMPDGTIRFRGLIRSGALNTIIARLPYQLAPQVNQMFTVFTNGGAARLDIAGRNSPTSAGALILRGGNTGYVNLNDIALTTYR